VHARACVCVCARAHARVCGKHSQKGNCVVISYITCVSVRARVCVCVRARIKLLKSQLYSD